MPRLSILIGIGLLLVGTATAPAQQNEKPEKATPAPIKLHTGPTYEYVQQAKSMKFDGTNMTLNGLAPSTIFFSDAPYRLAGGVDLKTFTDLWKGPNGAFAASPPNAALSVLGKTGEAPAIVALTSAAADGDGVKYGVKVISGKLPESAENVSLFIDHVHHIGGPRAGAFRIGNTRVGYVHPYHPLPGPYCYHNPQAPECHYLHPVHPYHPIYPYRRYPYYYHPYAVAGAAAAGAAVGAAVASQPQPVYYYPIPTGPLPAHCYINSNHTRMICSVPINQ